MSTVLLAYGHPTREKISTKHFEKLEKIRKVTENMPHS